MESLSFISLNVEGYSNFLWVILLASLGRLGVNFVIASRVLSLLGLVAVAVCIRKAGRDLRFPVGATALGLVIVANPCIAYWLCSGLETVFFSSLLCVATALLAISSAKPRRMLLGFSFASLGALTRSDGFLFALASILVVLCFFRRAIARAWMPSQ